QQGDQVRQDQARHDRAQNRAGNLSLGNAHPARAPFGEPRTHEDAEGDQGSAGGERATSADRDLAELEVGAHEASARVDEVRILGESPSLDARSPLTSLMLRDGESTSQVSRIAMRNSLASNGIGRKRSGQ